MTRKKAKRTLIRVLDDNWLTRCWACGEVVGNPEQADDRFACEVCGGIDGFTTEYCLHVRVRLSPTALNLLRTL